MPPWRLGRVSPVAASRPTTSLESLQEADMMDVSKDILHGSAHSMMSAEEVAKAVARHEHKHKGDADKKTRAKIVAKKK
jgi:hypothetical protein